MKRFLIVAVLLAGCSGAPASEDGLAGPEQPFELVFDWPVGIDGTFNKYGTTANGERRTSIEMTWPISTESVEDGWLVRYGEVRDLEITGLTADQKKMVEPVVQALPSIRFDGNSVAGIVGYEPMVKRLHEMMAPMYEQNPALETQIRASMTPEMFLESARDEWEWRVTVWDGRTMKVGEPVEQATELKTTFLPGTLPATETLTLDEVMPCPKAPERQCVRLLRRVEISDEVLREALSGPLGGARIDLVERYTELDLIAEPDTLLTHEMRQVEVVRLQGEGLTAVEQRKVSRELYEWNREPSE